MELAIKFGLHQYLEELVLDRMVQAEKALADIILSRDNESKSTAGDKYETGRSMMQIAQQQQEMQVQASQNFLQHLKSLKTDKASTKIGLGSMVETDQGIFYLSVSLGEVNYQDKSYYIISMASPIAQLFLEKKQGAVLQFRNKNYTILSIL